MNRAGVVAWGGALLLMACGLDERAPLRTTAPEEPAAGAGGTANGAVSTPAPPVASPTEASPPSESGVPVSAIGSMPVTLSNNGAACSLGEDCESSRCEPGPLAGASVCCSLDCADDARCSADGARCEPLPRALGEACGAGLACAGNLACAPAGNNANICCSTACAVGEFCVDGGNRCEVPLRQLAEACTSNGQCSSGYCDLDQKICRDNPCSNTIAGSYCARGAQCDDAGSCSFTGMGMVAAGLSHTCAILANGNVRCWGDNQFGQLGARLDLPLVGDIDVPSQVPSLRVDFTPRRAIQVSGAVGHTCALLDDGNVRCWGRNLENQLVPTRADGDIFLPAGARAVQIDTGGGHSCALLSTGELTCWGLNASGQCGLGHTLPLENVELPKVQLAEPARLVSTDNANSCALLESGALTCWGAGTAALGYASAGVRAAPAGNVDVGARVLTVSAGQGATCAVIEGGFVRCWGSNRAGILGYAHADNIGLNETPAQAAALVASNGRPLGGNVALGGGGVVQVEVNTDSGHVCARFSGGAVRCWGNNAGGSLGYGHELDIGDDETPVQAAALGPNQIGGDVPLGRTALALASGGRCAVLNDRSVSCWGRNSAGQLGMPALFPDGTPTLTPAEVVSSGIGPVSIE